MLNRKELAKIAKLKGNDHYFVSCYLNVDPVSNTRGDYLIHIKNMIREALENQYRKISRKIRPDMEKIDSYIFANKRDFKKGLAIISSTQADIWREFHFSVGLKNEIIVDNVPYIKPLLNILDLFQRYAVMIIDKESARLFAVHLGEIEEYEEIYTENIPGRHKKGGWFSLSERSYERHTDYLVNLHVKDVIRHLRRMLSEGDISRLVVGGTEEALSVARANLSKETADKIIGTFAVSITANVNDILAKAQTVIDSFEYKKSSAAIDELWTRTMKKENAVTGIDDVLSALQEGKVQRLIFAGDYRDSGSSCKKCGFLTSQSLDKCPYCGIEMLKVNYIIDHAAQKALEQGASVEVVRGNDKLEKAGSIGAFLRY